VKNSYVGDIGDFGKYGLLRILGKTGLSLGVVWHLTPDEQEHEDGRFTDYLTEHFRTLKRDG
jgi:hypothetical protein